MFVVGGDSWTVGTGHDPAADFCVWVLERDGLRAPPFDRHPGGDGRLRAAGMDADSWRAWLAAAVAARRERGRLMAASWPPEFDALRRLEPEAVWPGNAAVGALLRQLAPVYWREFHNDRSDAALAGTPAGAARDRAIAGAMERLREADDGGAGPVGTGPPREPLDRTLWDALLPFRDAIPGSLGIALVAYPGPLRLALPPSTLVLGALGWRPDRAAYVREVVAGAEGLAALNG